MTERLEQQGSQPKQIEWFGGGSGRKWVITHKNLTIQLVGPVLKHIGILATRASEAQFWPSKSSLLGSVYVCWQSLTWQGVYVELEFLRLEFHVDATC